MKQKKLTFKVIISKLGKTFCAIHGGATIATQSTRDPVGSNPSLVAHHGARQTGGSPIRGGL